MRKLEDRIIQQLTAHHAIAGKAMDLVELASLLDEVTISRRGNLKPKAIATPAFMAALELASDRVVVEGNTVRLADEVRAVAAEIAVPTVSANLETFQEGSTEDRAIESWEHLIDQGEAFSVYRWRTLGRLSNKESMTKRWHGVYDSASGAIAIMERSGWSPDAMAAARDVVAQAVAAMPPKKQGGREKNFRVKKVATPLPISGPSPLSVALSELRSRLATVKAEADQARARVEEELTAVHRLECDRENLEAAIAGVESVLGEKK